MAFTRKYQCSALMRKNLGGSTTIYFPCFDMEIEDTFRFSLFRRAQAAANEALANYVRKNRCVPPLHIIIQTQTLAGKKSSLS